MDLKTFTKEVLQQGLAWDMLMHDKLMRHYHDLQREVVEKENRILRERYMVRRIFLAEERNNRIASMRSVMDMLSMLDKAIKIKKGHIAFLEFGNRNGDVNGNGNGTSNV